METNLIKLMSIAIGASMFIFGLSIFLNMYSSFMRSEIVYEDRISPDEKTLEKYYDKSDIFYSYSKFKEMKDDEELDNNSSSYAEIIVEGTRLDYSKEEEEILTFLFSFDGTEFNKSYSFNGNKLEKIIYTSR